MPRSSNAHPAGDHLSPTAVALGAVGRLLSAPDEASLLQAVVDGARACFDAQDAIVLLPDGERLRIATGPLAGTAVSAGDHPQLADLLARRLALLTAGRRQSRALETLLTGAKRTGMALLLRLSLPAGDAAVLVLTGLTPPPMDTLDVSVATGFADATAAGLARVRGAEEHRRQAEHQRALSRAARLLNESLDLATVTARIAQEAVTMLGADTCAVYRRMPDDSALLDYGYGTPAGAVGFVIGPGEGVAGRIMVDDQPRIENDYQATSGLSQGTPMDTIRSALGAPMRWDGETRGSLTIGYHTQREISPADLELLEAFADLAANAYGNATAHAGIVKAARTDGLTGCLNHSALQQGLVAEVERARRGDAALSLALIDLDRFKQLNDTHGHLAGDDALRRVGAALRQVSRPYDLVARYGGDEFALVMVGADEQAAAEIAARALERLDAACSGLLPAGARAATIGVAQWRPRQEPTALLAAADRALRFAKQHAAGSIRCAADVPADVPHDAARRLSIRLHAPELTGVEDRLRRRTQQLALANALGTRLVGMTDEAEICEATAEELHRAFGYFCCAVVRRDGDVVRSAALRGDPFLKLHAEDWSHPFDVGLVGRCITTGRPVLANDVALEPDYAVTDHTHEVRSELVVPVRVGDVVWGAINLEEVELDAFDLDDLMLAETIAAQVGSALRSVAYYDRLERAYLQTAEALAGALEAKDAYTADHARQIAEQAATVATAMGLDEAQVRDVRLAAILHDIGKIAVPEHILNKPGPLTDEEFEVVKRHTVVGEQILAPVEFLAGVCPLVRHEHERYDGGGYPDGLAGDAIPLGSRIILACDALHAMTSDRPYRKALSLETARDELRRHAGTQFDPAVVDTLLAVSAAEAPAALAG